MSTLDAAELPPGVTLREGGGGMPVLDVSTPACTGQVHLHGAHVVAWTPTGEQPVLWCSEQSRFAPDAPIRGGVPICAPWFGPGRDGTKTPAHGYFRVATWTLAGAREEGADIVLQFTLTGAREQDLPGSEAAPADLEATYTVRMGRDLSLSLEIVTPTQPLDLENALHAYLAVGDVRTTTILGLDGARYADKAPGGRAVNAQSGPVEFKRETDRVYSSTEVVTVHDPQMGRRLVISKEGSNSTIVWNPWERKAEQLPDFGDDEWTGMLCVEPGNALKGLVHLQPGDRHTLSATVAVVPL